MPRTILAFRAIIFVFLLPGTVAVYVPYRILRTAHEWRVPPLAATTLAAAALVAAGALVLLRCVWDFFDSGAGTLAPVDPPKRLVVRGLYRFTRNPMYNGVLLMVLAEAWLFRSAHLVTYAIGTFLTVHLFVVFYEERTLARRFGEPYREYRQAVPRWGFTLRSPAEERSGSA